MSKHAWSVASALTMLFILGLLNCALGEDFVWTGAASGDWNDKANWETPKKKAVNRFPDKAGDVAIFRSVANGSIATLSKAVTVNMITFNNADDKGFTITDKTLNFDSGNGTASVVKAVRGFNTIASKVAFDKNNLNFDIGIGSDIRIAKVTVTGVISSTNAKLTLTKEGAGILVLSAANTYDGPTVIQRGQLQVTTDKALGTTASGTTVNNGGILVFNNVAYATKEAVTLNVGGAIRGLKTSSFDGAVTIQSTKTPTDRVFWQAPSQGDSLQFNGAIGQSAANTSVRIVKTGNGTVILNAANTFTSGLLIREGSLQVNVDKALGTTAGSTTIGNPNAVVGELGGTLIFNKVQYKTAEPLQIAGKGDRGLAINNIGGDSLFVGPISLQVSAAPKAGPNSDIGVTKGTELTLSGIISQLGQTPQKLTKVDVGTLVLSGANAYTGGTEVQAGTLVVTNSSALGEAAKGALTKVDNGATLALKGGITIEKQPITITGSGVGNNGVLQSLDGTNVIAKSSPITLDGNPFLPAVISVAKGSELRIRSVIDEVTLPMPMPTKLNKIGDGRLVLSGANTYTGGTEVMAGTLVAANSSALGVPGKNASSVVDKGATLGLRGGITLDNQPVTISGTGVDGKGAIYNIDGNNTFGPKAPITLNGNATIGAADNTNLAFQGSLDKNGATLTLQPGMKADISFDDKAANAAIKGVGDVVVDGPGKVTILAGSTYTGPTRVLQGTLEVDNTSGSATGLAQVSVHAGATLQGTGIILGPTSIEAGGILHPGTENPGVLSTLGSVSLASGSTFQVLMGGVDAGDGSGFHSQLLVTGGTTLGGSVLDLILTAPPVIGAEYDILRNLDNVPISGRFAGLPEGTIFDVGSPFGTYEFDITYFGGNSIYHDGSHHDVVLTALAAVPEPGQVILVVLMAAGALALRLPWRKRLVPA